MDLVMVVEFSMVGLPLDTYLAMIGSILGGGAPLGVALHLLMGSLLGLGSSVGVLKLDVLPIETARRGVGLGVLAGIASISLCVPFAILTGTPVATLLSFSIIPHLAWGAVFGVIAGYGMRSASVASPIGN